MSGQDLSSNVPPSMPVGPGRTPLTPLVKSGRQLLVGAAFWSAVLLPWVYLPMLAVASVETALYLLGVHVAALVLGHGYRRQS
jgi:hypothetical protein